MPITVSSQAGSATITLSGEIDHHGARAMMEQLEDAIARALPLRLTLDLSGVTFMDSSGIAVLLRAHTGAVLAAGGEQGGAGLLDVGDAYPGVLHLHLQHTPLQQSKTQGNAAQTVGIGVDDGIGYRLAHGGLDVRQLVQGGVQLGGEAGGAGPGEPLVGRAGSEEDGGLVDGFHYVALLIPMG